MKGVSNHRKKIKAKQTGKKRGISSESAEPNAGSYYRILFESAQHGILLIHAKTGSIEDANPYLLNLLGYSQSELLRKKVWQLHVDSETAKQNYDELSEKGTDRWYTHSLVAKNGSVVAVELISSIPPLRFKCFLPYPISSSLLIFHTAITNVEMGRDILAV